MPMRRGLISAGGRNAAIQRRPYRHAGGEMRRFTTIACRSITFAPCRRRRLFNHPLDRAGIASSATRASYFSDISSCLTTSALVAARQAFRLLVSPSARHDARFNIFDRVWCRRAVGRICQRYLLACQAADKRFEKCGSTAPKCAPLRRKKCAYKINTPTGLIKHKMISAARESRWLRCASPSIGLTLFRPPNKASVMLMMKHQRKCQYSALSVVPSPETTSWCARAMPSFIFQNRPPAKYGYSRLMGCVWRGERFISASISALSAGRRTIRWPSAIAALAHMKLAARAGDALDYMASDAMGATAGSRRAHDVLARR